MDQTFVQWKRQCLSRLDLSKKASVDEHIEHVVSLLNSCEQYFTTSSCSGRIILIDGVCAVARSSGEAVLKFEPFVLHAQCRRLDDAQLLHSVAINSGFRNSGLTVSKTGKIITAVRNTHGLEVPLSHEGKLLVEHEYISFLTQIANQKMEENHRRIHRFYQNLQTALSTEKLKKLQIPDPPSSQELQDSPCRPETENGEADEKEDKIKTSVYKRRRKRQHHHQTDCCHGDGSSNGPEPEDCLDLFT
ncbi:tRNA wybutosine-synthesizing protein 3 homolog isoform X2 [Acanthopagrus latus]|uniref:tRNA wybutosine-synthesizing protein 3 homolog isoform X2 n=1 Tax=Acanthopagrus latus TaxID=8177 RepID=UPI00187C25E1|nr:tRNA wybutosine-synthesizing protein 3 homolog isoform X2 [Acanthopagrus latus]